RRGVVGAGRAVDRPGWLLVDADAQEPRAGQVDRAAQVAYPGELRLRLGGAVVGAPGRDAEHTPGGVWPSRLGELEPAAWAAGRRGQAQSCGVAPGDRRAEHGVDRRDQLVQHAVGRAGPAENDLGGGGAVDADADR